MAALQSPGQILENILTGNFGPEQLQALVAPAAAIFMISAAAGDLGSTFFDTPVAIAPDLESIAVLANVLKA